MTAAEPASQSLSLWITTAMQLRTMGTVLNTPYLKQTIRDVVGCLAGLLVHQKQLADKERSGEAAKQHKHGHNIQTEGK